MAVTSRTAEELRQRKERLRAIGEMTAKFAHEVRTPLASAMLYTAQLDQSNPQQQRVAQKISARLNDLGRMVNDMLGFAAGAKRAQEWVGVLDLLTDVRLSQEAQLGESIDLRIVVADPTLKISANRDALNGALLNLVTNAIQACNSPAKIVITAERDADSVNISVTDNGSGVDRSILPRLFEPFFTTRPQGTGLGLAVVRAVARAHDGDVSVTTSDAGTTFRIRLPASCSDPGKCNE